MGIAQMNIWKFGAFKIIGNLFSSPRHTVTCIHVGEDGIVSKNSLPLNTGFCSIEAIRKTWLCIQSLKTRLQGVSEEIMVITYRSYKPVNPQRNLSQKEEKDLLPLDDIATIKYIEAETQIAAQNQKSQNTQLLRFCLTSCIVITCIVLIIVFFVSR